MIQQPVNTANYLTDFCGANLTQRPMYVCGTENLGNVTENMSRGRKSPAVNLSTLQIDKLLTVREQLCLLHYCMPILA